MQGPSLIGALAVLVPTRSGSRSSDPLCDFPGMFEAVTDDILAVAWRACRTRCGGGAESSRDRFDNVFSVRRIGVSLEETQANHTVMPHAFPDCESVV
jgi:hypothetical protein